MDNALLRHRAGTVIRGALLFSACAAIIAARAFAFKPPAVEPRPADAPASVEISTMVNNYWCAKDSGAEMFLQQIDYATNTGAAKAVAAKTEPKLVEGASKPRKSPQRLRKYTPAKPTVVNNLSSTKVPGEKADSYNVSHFPITIFDGGVNVPEDVRASLAEVPYIQGEKMESAPGTRTVVLRRGLLSQSYVQNICENMETLHNHSPWYRDIYFEGMPESLQGAIKEYLSNKKNGEMSVELSEYLSSVFPEIDDNPLFGMFEKAKELNWNVIACPQLSLSSITAGAQVVVFSDVHPLYQYRDFIADSMEVLDKAGFKRIYLELLSPDLQPVIQLYLRTGEMSQKLSTGLLEVAHSAYYGGEKGRTLYQTSYFKILSRAKELGWDVVPIWYPRYPGPDYLKETDRHYADIINLNYDEIRKNDHVKEKVEKRVESRSLALIGKDHHLHEYVPGAKRVIPLLPEQERKYEVENKQSLPSGLPNGVYRVGEGEYVVLLGK